MRRQFTSYRRIIALIAVLGLLAPFQMVFACDHMDGKDRLICCCDEPGMMGVLEGSLEEHFPDQCCDVSIEEKYKGVSQGPNTHGYSLDHAQPPPILTSSYTLEILLTDGLTHSVDSVVPLPTSNPVYLLTNRFLI